MQIDNSIFRAYDVRGIYPSQINEPAVAMIAKAFAWLCKANKVVLGRDARHSSPSLYSSIIKSLTDAGVDVYDIGICPTPLLHYAAASKGFAAGIMISASHNPPQYNALKLVKDGLQISSPGLLDEVKLLSMKGQVPNTRNQKGQVYTMDVLEAYKKEVVTDFEGSKQLKIAVDYSIGMGSITAKPVFELLGMKVIALNEKIDCDTPKHPANPEDEKNLDELRQAVVSNKADLGIFFDGDADRSVFVDDTGKVVYPDIISALLAPHELQGRSEKRIYYDLRCSKILEDVIRKNKGTPVMMRVGNVFYKEKLRTEGGIFGVELSGHFMFQDHYCIDDGLYSSLKLISTIGRIQKPFSKQIEPLQKYFTSPEINTQVRDPDLVLEKVRREFKDGKSQDIDGVYVAYDDWWFDLRKSNTEPLVRLRLEATTKEKLELMKDKIISVIRS